VHCGGNPSLINDVQNPITGRTWMDRNLGASQVAVNSTDANAYGDLYQWGRRGDGHQCRNSSTTSTASSTNQPSHGLFITYSPSPYDWRVPQNANLWQGVNGVNNPCPSGYRLPTEAEFTAERQSWSPQNGNGAFNSPLKWSLGGARNYNNGTLTSVGSVGVYWTSTADPGNIILSRRVSFDNSGIYDGGAFRGNGYSVRCIKE
jgi:uncharacterized protein (TIGR02145 family)